MRVLVTGSGGFLGRAVVAELEKQHHVAEGLDRPWDICYYDDIATRGNHCDAVIHMAGVLGTHELFDTVELAIDVNIKGTVNVLEWCRANNAAYVGITMPQVFPSIYTATKVAATRMASAYHLTYGVPVSHVRAFNAFGPGQAHGPGHPQKIIPTFATHAWAGIPIPIWGDGTQTVDLIYVDDLARLLVGAFGYGDDEVFDGGTGTPFSVNVIAKRVQEIVAQNGGPIEFHLNHLPMRRGEVPTDIVARGEGWDKLYKPHFRYEDLVDTVLSYQP